MSTLAPFGFQAGQSRRSVNEYYVPASDTSAYAVGDPVRSTGNVFVGRLPDSRVSQGMLHVGKAAPGQAVRGVVVGIVGGPGDNSAQSVPATKQRAYTLLVNDSPQAVWDVQANNTAVLSVMGGMYASYTVGGPLGGVSSTVVDASSIGATVSDLLIVEVLTNTGANSLLRVAFVQHELAAGGGSPQIGASIQSLVSDAGKFPRIIKQFSDLLGVTFATSNATYVATIDPASPFGCPALKVVCTWSTTGGRVEIIPPALGIPKFNGHVGYTLWIDDATKVGQVGTILGTTAFANSTQFDDKIFAGSDQCVSGPRVTWVGPMKQASSQALTIDTFVYGTDTLATTKLRIVACNPLVTGGTATVWIKDCWIAKPQRPVCVFSFDDGYDSWATTVLPALAQYGYKGTFGIDAEMIDGGGGITSANMAAVVAAEHHIASHNQFNYRLQILTGQGSGEQNGSGTSQDVTAYAAAYHGGRATYEALGADPDGFVYHPWVQGGPDRAGVDALAGAGVDIARGTSPYEPMMYGAPCLYDSAMNLRSIALSPSYTLAQVKARILSAYQNGGIAFLMGHDFVASSPTGVQWLSSDFYALVEYVHSLGIEVLTAKQLRDRLAVAGLIQDRRDQKLANTQQPVRMIGRLLAANMNSTADQSIPLMAGTWKVEGVYFTKPSVTLSGSAAAGGVYSAAAKGGTAIVAAAQSYGSGLVAATDVLGPPTAATATITSATGTTPVYLSLTTAHGSAATADVFVFGRPA